MPSTAPKIYRLPVKKKPGSRTVNGVEYIRKHIRYEDPVTKVKKSKYVYGQTEAEVKKKTVAFERLIAQGLRVSEQGKTVGQWADDWLRVYKKPKVSKRTYANYDKDVRIIKKAIGYKPLNSVTELDVVAVMNTRIGLSASAIHHTYIVLNAIFASAVQNRLIPINPCVGAEIPDGPSGTHRALEPREIKIIEKVAKTHRLGAGIMLMLWGGLRKSEACAFTSDCIQGDELRITEAVEWAGNQGDLKGPKSEAGYRTVPIWPKLKPYLRNPGYAITHADGSAPVSDVGYRRAFESFMVHCERELNGCTKRWKPENHVWKTMDFTAHDLRHTWFTMLYDAGVDVKIAAVWGGHSDINVTMKVYQHIREDRLKKEAKKAIMHNSKKRPGGKSGGKPKTYYLTSLVP